MKKLIFLMVMLLPLSSFAQSNDTAKQLTKYEEISSKTGSIVKLYDVKTESIPQSFMGMSLPSLQTKIRIIKGKGFNSYFYRLEDFDPSTKISHIAMIEYSDLVEINKALTILASEAETDKAENPDYMENKYITVDGVEVGYYIKNGEFGWVMKLDRYSKSTVYINSTDVILTAFKNAQTKIEELKAIGK